MHKYQQLISDCFWEYNFSAEDIDQIIASGDSRKNQFVFAKILANSTHLLKDLKIFPIEKLASLTENYTVPKFNYDFPYRRKKNCRIPLSQERSNIRGTEVDKVDYTALYRLQDRALDTIFSCEHDFYLTGGTCLSRFYQAKRYSDDLDFFTNSSNIFGFTIKKIKILLAEKFDLKSEIEAKDFCRLRIDNLLQLDFVNDRVAHFKDLIVLENGYIIDNIENILSNKITAVIGRDDPKDIFDIYLIARFYSFDWQVIIDSSREKSAYNLEDLIVRMESFPPELLARIKLIDTTFLDNFATTFRAIIEEIIEGSKHHAQCLNHHPDHPLKP